MNIISIGSVMKSVIPISRLNKGEASKVFEEVRRDGVKIVMKNNDPSCVLVSPERYIEMEELLEDYLLADEAERREKMTACPKTISHEDILTRYGITKEEIDAADVEIG